MLKASICILFFLGTWVNLGQPGLSLGHFRSFKHDNFKKRMPIHQVFHENPLYRKEDYRGFVRVLKSPETNKKSVDRKRMMMHDSHGNIRILQKCFKLQVVVELRGSSYYIVCQLIMYVFCFVVKLKYIILMFIQINSFYN